MSFAVAHGIRGVGVYDLDSQGQPALRQTLWTGGIVRSVAVRQGVLAVARQDGAVKLYRLGDPIREAGKIHGLGQIDRVRLVGGRLWVLSKKNDRVKVFSIADPDAPVPLGSFTEEAAGSFRSQWLGSRVYTYGQTGHLLEVKHVEARP